MSDTYIPGAKDAVDILPLPGDDIDDATPKPDPQPGEGADKDKPKDKDGEGGEPEPKLTARERKELDRLRAELEETRFSEKQLRKTLEQVTAKPAERKGGKPEGDDDEEDPLDAGDPSKDIEELTTKGLKTLQKKGFLTAKDAKKLIASVVSEMESKVDAKVEARVQEFVRNADGAASLLNEYPELRDAKSEFSQAVKAEYAALVDEDPDLKESRTAWKMAARLVAARNGKDGRRADPEDDRRDRIRRQAPEVDSGRPNGSGGTRITSEEREFISRLGVKESDFLRQKSALGGRR
jgi:hypothetical protein